MRSNFSKILLLKSSSLLYYHNICLYCSVSDYVAANVWNLSEGNSTSVSVPVYFTLGWSNTSKVASAVTCQYLNSINPLKKWASLLKSGKME